jgi:hypothetical protein
MSGATSRALLHSNTLEIKGLDEYCAMHYDASKTGKSHSKRNEWPSMKLLYGIGGCLVLAFVWLAWSPYNTSHVANLIDARQIRPEVSSCSWMKC